MTTLEVVFIATPALGNLIPAVEFANLLTKHRPQLSATVLIITVPQRPLVNTYAQSRASSATTTTTNLRFLHLPAADPPAPDQFNSSFAFLSLLIQNHQHHIKGALLDLKSKSSIRIAALFVDMFTTTAIDIATELDIPCYLFFASPASFLSFTLHLPPPDAVETETEFAIPGFKNPLPRSVLPKLVLDAGENFSWVSYHAGRYRETKGIIVNTVQELEPHALQSLRDDPQLPPVYAVGPVLDLDGPARWDPNRAKCDWVIGWLNQQPPCSVVFLCFGSMGSLQPSQVEQIAIGLERAGVRFLWALREPPKTQLEDPRDYEDHVGVLPNGFLERTVKIGLVCGWVPQAKVLAHEAVGGFVSHCGWNSLLESLWHGVPVATWPVYAEQQMNAFEMVRELGVAVEIRLDYKLGGDLVRAEEVENGVRALMNGCDAIRRKVKEMSEKCRMALVENGSSYNDFVSLVEELTS